MSIIFKISFVCIYYMKLTGVIFFSSEFILSPHSTTSISATIRSTKNTSDFGSVHSSDQYRELKVS